MFCLLKVAVISFVSSYEVMEGTDCVVNLVIAVVSGQLKETVAVCVFTIEDSAKGILLN